MNERRLCFVAAFCLLGFTTHAIGRQGNWVASGGFGMSFSPSLVLFSPQLEYVHKDDLFVGPLLQVAPGVTGVLFTASATVRKILGGHPNVKPCLEAGVGIAMLGSSPGVLVHAGMGFDYVVDKQISIGTVVRADFAPPASTFFVTWPILVGRFAL